MIGPAGFMQAPTAQPAPPSRVQLWDVWQCWVGRTSWRATPYREDDALRPASALVHWDTVEAPSAREALRLSMKQRDAS